MAMPSMLTARKAVESDVCGCCVRTSRSTSTSWNAEKLWTHRQELVRSLLQRDFGSSLSSRRRRLAVGATAGERSRRAADLLGCAQASSGVRRRSSSQLQLLADNWWEFALLDHRALRSTRLERVERRAVVLLNSTAQASSKGKPSEVGDDDGGRHDGDDGELDDRVAVGAQDEHSHERKGREERMRATHMRAAAAAASNAAAGAAIGIKSIRVGARPSSAASRAARLSRRSR